MRLKGDLRGVSHGSILPPAVVIGVTVLLGTLTGLAVVAAPAAAWALLGSAIAVVLLLSPAHLRIGSAVLAAVGSRLVVATGVAPGLVNFLHYPLALAAALASAVETQGTSPVRKPLEIGLLGFLGVSLLSWAVNGGEFLRPILDWLVFSEPFLIVYAIVNMRPEAKSVVFLRALSLAIFFGQLPLMFYQTLTLGVSDPVQGFFIGMGAGAHVAGAVCLTGTLVCLAKGLAEGSTRKRLLWLLGGGALFLATVLADAKQVILAFLPALVLLLFLSTKLRVKRVLASLPLVTVGILGAFSLYRPLQVTLDWALIGRGILGKAQAFGVLAEKIGVSWSQWIIGLGPGNSISRVAQMGLEAFVRPNSPVAALNLGPATATRELVALTASNRLFSSSSVWSAISSWLGLLGDFGLAGFFLFAWMLFRVWKNVRARTDWEAVAARATLLMMCALAFLYSWLEEPGFTLVAALVVGLGSISAGSPLNEESLPHPGVS